VGEKGPYYSSRDRAGRLTTVTPARQTRRTLLRPSFELAGLGSTPCSRVGDWPYRGSVARHGLRAGAIEDTPEPLKWIHEATIETTASPARIWEPLAKVDLRGD